jgi:hypothetical protein
VAGPGEAVVVVEGAAAVGEGVTADVAVGMGLAGVGLAVEAGPQAAGPSPDITSKTARVAPLIACLPSRMWVGTDYALPGGAVTTQLDGPAWQIATARDGWSGPAPRLG